MEEIIKIWSEISAMETFHYKRTNESEFVLWKDKQD
jgi:hypothetical protein